MGLGLGGEVELWLVGVELVEEGVEVVAGELPLEGAGDLFVAAAEGEEVLLEGLEVGEVVWLALCVGRLRSRSRLG